MYFLFKMFCNEIMPMFIICAANIFLPLKSFQVKDYSKSVLKVKNINCQVEWIFILKIKALRPRCLRHSSKKKRGSPFLWEKKQFMEIAIFNITDYLHSVLTIIKSRESAGMWWIHMQYISACQWAEPLIEHTQVEDFFVSLMPLPWDRKVIVW